MAKPDLETLQKAVDNTEGRTPKEVLDAFIPKGQKVAGLPLVDVTFGHALFFASIDHPFSRKTLEGWEAQDVGIALFALTRTSKELHKHVKDDTFESALYEFLEEIPSSDIEVSTAALIGHYFNSMKTGVAMKSPVQDNKPQKKTLLAGFSQVLRRLVGNTSGSRTT